MRAFKFTRQKSILQRLFRGSRHSRVTCKILILFIIVFLKYLDGSIFYPAMTSNKLNTSLLFPSRQGTVCKHRCSNLMAADRQQTQIRH